MTSDNLSLVDVINKNTDSENTIQDTGIHDWSCWSSDSQDIDGGDHTITDNFATGVPNPTLEPDWDVIHEIKWTYQQQLQGGTLIHTKGHQDDREKYSALSLLAQLNVDADRLAQQYQDRHGASHPMVLLFPHAAAQLTIPEGTITSRLPFVLRMTEHGYPLRDYIRAKYRWSQSEFDTINWDAHCAAVKAHNKQRIHITKMLHEVLPTNYQIHRGAPPKQGCPSCSFDKEDRDHIMRCKTRPREAWRSATIVALQNKCTTLRTSKIMTSILVQGIHAWFHDRQLTFRPEKPVPPAFLRLISQQNAIGWRQLFHGRFSREWARLHDDHLCILRQQHDQDSRYLRATIKRTGDQWCQDITTVLWSQWTVLWNLRNEVVHGRDAAERTRMQDATNRRKLRHIYAQRDFMEPSVRELLFDNVTEHETLPQHSITNWLAVHEDIFTQSIKRAAQRAIRGVRNIKSYFTVYRPDHEPQENNNNTTLIDRHTASGAYAAEEANKTTDHGLSVIQDITQSAAHL